MVPLLRVEDLSVSFRTAQGLLPAVDRLSFDMAAGETVALVGETGCGKSTAALALTRLLAQPPAVITARSVLFDGRELVGLPEEAMRELRGRSIAMVFQDPAAYLNPTSASAARSARRSNCTWASTGTRHGRARSNCCG